MRRRFNYTDYLRSPEWAEVRRKIIKRYKGRCAICNGPGEAVHHWHYRTLGRERLFDCALVCTSCHSAWHQRLGAEVRVD